MIWKWLVLVVPVTALAQDVTWMNGQSRQRTLPLTVGQSVRLSFYIDTYYAFSTHRPRDHTLGGSASIGRHGEVQLNLASAGIEWSRRNVIGRLSVQAGDMLDLVQEQDGSVNRGRNISTANLKYVREASIGYHWDVASGMNVEAGILASYVGLESYLLGENWNYTRSFVTEFTPFYFQGVRLQLFPNARWKLEPWVMNGWQSYGAWNDVPSTGLSVVYRPREALGFVVNAYSGFDTPNEPSRHRFHTDHSILARYFNAPGSRGVSKAAFSINNHVGTERGGAPPAASFVGTAIANRVWFRADHLALTVRGEAVSNPGRYAAIVPTPSGFGDNGRELRLRGLTLTWDVMPDDLFAWRIEYSARGANTPYYSSRTGLGESQHLFATAVNFRM